MSSQTPGEGPKGPKGPSSKPVPGLTQEQIDAFERDLDRMLFEPPANATPDDGRTTRPVPAQKGWIRMKVPQRPVPQPPASQPSAPIVPAPQAPPRTKDEERLARFANLTDEQFQNVEWAVGSTPYPNPAQFQPTIVITETGEKLLEVGPRTDLLLALQYLQAARDHHERVVVDLAAVSRAIDVRGKQLRSILGKTPPNEVQEWYESRVKRAREADVAAAEELRYANDLLGTGDETLRRFLEFQTPA